MTRSIVNQTRQLYEEMEKPKVVGVDHFSYNYKEKYMRNFMFINVNVALFDKDVFFRWQIYLRNCHCFQKCHYRKSTVLKNYFVAMNRA